MIYAPTNDKTEGKHGDNEEAGTKNTTLGDSTCDRAVARSSIPQGHKLLPVRYHSNQRRAVSVMPTSQAMKEVPTVTNVTERSTRMRRDVDVSLGPPASSHCQNTVGLIVSVDRRSM